MRSVDAIGARQYSAALLLFLPAIMLVIDVRAVAGGEYQPASRCPRTWRRRSATAT
jgi:hypothetical protein